jgi:uncharacterized protein with von Willebrand factor type A (vWA) domain
MSGGNEADSRLADNVLLFCRTLREAGLPIGPGQVIDACEAILKTGIERRDDFRTALRAVLVTDPTQFELFDQAFRLYFRNPRLLERMMGLLLPTLERETDEDGGDQAIRRLLEAMSSTESRESDEVVIEIDRADSWSRREILRDKDFEQMNLEELREAKQMFRETGQIVRQVATRRFRPDSRGHRYDLRKSVQKMLKNDGELIELARRKRRTKPPALVLLCDISGSMSRYSRMFMHFAHALSTQGQVVHTFVFGTRLTNITRWLAGRDVDKALARVAEEVRDWDGGTRIADSLERFNVDWGRRVLSGRSVVILLSDGLERDSEADLGFQMARLRRSAEQLVWLNPMLRYEHFEARAAGMKAMLPHVDRFLPAHNVSSLSELGSLLASGAGRRDRAA